MKNKFNLKLNELPLRERKLDPDETSKIFGGCQQEYLRCDSIFAKCCDGFVCKEQNLYRKNQYLCSKS